MKFLFDAHLPPSLTSIFNDHGYKSLHTTHMRNGNQSSDFEIIEFAEKEGYIVVTKDFDFYYSPR